MDVCVCVGGGGGGCTLTSENANVRKTSQYIKIISDNNKKIIPRARSNSDVLKLLLLAFI